METYKLTVNGQQKEVTVDPSTPLLWVLREELKMSGTKYGCGISACGACTVHIAGQAARSCVLPVSLVNERPIVTIEAMALVEYGTYSIRAKWRSLQSAQGSMLKKDLDTADIVRDGLLNEAAMRQKKRTP